MSEALLAASGLTIGYRHPRHPAHIVAQNLRFDLGAGEFVCIVGPNGAGKSTLIRTLAAMQAPLAGRVLLHGSDIHRLPTADLARTVSVVLTERVGVGAMRSEALVALGRYPYTDWFGTLSAHDHEIVQWAIDAVKASELAERDFNTLSDGERQRILIARALAQQPRLMVLDEPTAFLDLPRRVELMALLRSLAHDTGQTMLMSTHDLDLALRTADRMWLLPHGGPLHAGAPEDLVLSGAFEQAFASEGVTFDTSTGAFTMDVRVRGAVQVVGEGLVAKWTSRALQRAGYEVTRADAPVRVELSTVDGMQTWQVTDAEGSIRCGTLYEVVNVLRSLSGGPDRPSAPEETAG